VHWEVSSGGAADVILILFHHSIGALKKYGVTRMRLSGDRQQDPQEAAR
jgi:hypothetical protein